MPPLTGAVAGRGRRRRSSALFAAPLICQPVLRLVPSRRAHQERAVSGVLPLELSLVNDLPVNVSPSRSRQPLGGTPPLIGYFLDDNAYTREGDAFWVRGESRGPTSCCGRRSSIETRRRARWRGRSCGAAHGVQLETGPVPNRVTHSHGGRDARSSTCRPTIAARCRARCGDGLPYKPYPETPTNYVYAAVDRQRHRASFRCSRPAAATTASSASSCGWCRSTSRPLAHASSSPPSSPPFVEGGHLVIARELVRACASAGHDADLVVTPQNRFGRQGSGLPRGVAAPTSAWPHEGRTVDHVICLRYPAFAVRHPHHVVLAQSHDARVLRPLADSSRASLSWRNRIKERMRRALHPSRRSPPADARVQRLFVISGTVQARLQRWGGMRSRGPPSAAAGARRTAATATATTCSPCRG